jgi:hypothetical protein
MQFMPQLAAMKLPQGDHRTMHKKGGQALGTEAAGCAGGMQLSSTVTSALGTWKMTGWAEDSHMATKYMRKVL